MIKLFTVLGMLMLYIIITGIGGVISSYISDSSDHFFIGAYITGLIVFVAVSMYIAGWVNAGM